MQTIDMQKLMAISPWKAGDALPADDPKLVPFLTFTTKAEYLEWRQAWKEAYRDLSKDIRDVRKIYRAEGSNHEFATIRQLYSWRALARTMLVLRHASKIRAESLYQASKATAEVA